MLEEFGVIPIDSCKSIKFYLGDCLEGMSTLQEKSVDVIVTSPPYNIGIKYGVYNDHLERNKYLKWMETIGEAIKNVLKDQGSFYLNVGNKPSDQWVAWDVANTLRKHFILQNTISWVKSIAISKCDAGNYPSIITDIAVGHFKPINSSRYLNDCLEYIFHFTKHGNVMLDKLAESLAVPYQDKSNIGRYSKIDKHDRGNTWFIGYETIKHQSERPHPATFPVNLPEKCIRLHGLQGDILVLDPFLGIGSTAIACAKLGISCIGFDIDRDYLAEAERRVNLVINSKNTKITEFLS